MDVRPNWNERPATPTKLDYRRCSAGASIAPDEKVAIAEAAKQFHITPARRNKLVVTKVVDTDRGSNKSPDRGRG